MRQLSTFNRRLSVMLFAALFLSAGSFAANASVAGDSYAAQQNQEVKGKVTSATDGSPIIGASVVLKSDPTVGTVTDVNGDFSIQAAPGDVLEVSYLGYKTQDVTAGTGVLNVQLQEDALAVEDVVVTALGIRREKKALGYSVEDIKGDRLLENRTGSVATSLAGKVAGLNITKTAVPGGSSRIIIRGNNSLLGNNMPLLVVDGVPFDNAQGVGSTDAVAWGSIDYGDGISAMNPDDIESISVLKGPSATALYGSRAGNGVILITTKKGTGSKGTTVSLTTNFMADKVMIQPEFQNEYGQGNGGVFNATSRASWGPRMEGQMITDWTGKTRPFLPYDNNYDDFLETGHTWNNTIEVASSSEKASVRASVSNSQTKGVVPNNELSKTNFTLRGTGELVKNLSFDAKVTYMYQKGQNRPAFSVDAYNPIFGLIYNPRSIHFKDYLPVADANGEVRIFQPGSQSLLLNPYWITQKTGNTDKTNRVNGFASLRYDIFPWLSLTGRYGLDYYGKTIENWYSKGGRVTGLSANGRYKTVADSFIETNADFLLVATGNNFWGSKFSGSASFGGNIMSRNYRTQSEDAQGLTIADLYTISNGMKIVSTNRRTRKEIQSLYGFAQLSYDNWVFLDVTARNDWSSTLPSDNRSFFYPSVSLGWVVSDMLRTYNAALPSWITYFKLRGSYAEAGNDTDPYQLLPYMTINPAIINNIAGATLPTTLANANLKPEIVKSWEFGAEARFLNSRLGIDVTYYHKKAYNQIISLATSITSGYTDKLINAGRVDNWGWEIVFNASPVQSKNWRWDLTFNWAKNNSEVKELYGDLKTITIGNPMGGNIKVMAEVGKPYGEIHTNHILRDDQGNKLVGDNGLYLVDTKLTRTGNMNPDWTGGLYSSLNFKGFYFNFLIDIRKGGDIFLNSLMRLSANGATKNTLPGRAEWYASNGTAGGMVSQGIVRSTGQPNTMHVDPEKYWNNFYNVFEPYVYDMTNVRMREMSLGYNFPARWFKNTPISGLKLSVVANNLFFFYNNIPGFDPESTYSTGNAQGVETASLPSTRSFGFNLNITF